MSQHVWLQRSVSDWVTVGQAKKPIPFRSPSGGVLSPKWAESPNPPPENSVYTFTYLRSISLTKTWWRGALAWHFLRWSPCLPGAGKGGGPERLQAGDLCAHGQGETHGGTEKETREVLKNGVSKIRHYSYTHCLRYSNTTYYKVDCKMIVICVPCARHPIS